MFDSNKKWSIIYLSVMFAFLFGIAIVTIVIDPYFHYHKPLVSFFYTLDNQRSQNDGIIKNFDYDAIITGTSMVENFKASELDNLFEVNSIKIPFSGGTLKEINDNLNMAINNNPNISMVVRAIDFGYFFDDKDRMRNDLGSYPVYLYDNDWSNDCYYILNKEIFMVKLVPMIADYVTGVDGGITSFDQYSNWMVGKIFGSEAVLGHRTSKFLSPNEMQVLTEQEKEAVMDNIEQNVIDVVKNNPDVKFYYFFPPYSAAWWGSKYQEGTLEKYILAEQCVIEGLLECDNVAIFSFNDNFEMITDLNNYYDYGHYGEWVNSYILNCMRTGEHQLTKENYIEYIETEMAFYTSFDYNSLYE